MKKQIQSALIMMIWSAALLMFAEPASAKLIDGVNNPKYAVRAPARFVQGVINISFGWSALLLDPVRASRQPDKKFVDGMFEGMGNVIAYSYLGAWDIGTFWVPAQAGKDMAGVKHNVFNL